MCANSDILKYELVHRFFCLKFKLLIKVKFGRIVLYEKFIHKAYVIFELPLNITLH